jgi:hypothetical protein
MHCPTRGAPLPVTQTTGFESTVEGVTDIGKRNKRKKELVGRNPRIDYLDAVDRTDAMDWRIVYLVEKPKFRFDGKITSNPPTTRRFFDELTPFNS